MVTDKKVNFTEKEVEDIYGIGRRQLRTARMRADDSGPEWLKVSGQLGRPGGRILYPRKSLERWLASRRGGGADPVPEPAR